MANPVSRPPSVHLRQTSGISSDAVIRGHKVAIDRPTAKGGTDLGPMGGELFLAAVGGCFMSNLLAAIAARQANVSDVQTVVTAAMGGSPERFTGIELSVSGDCADPHQFEKLVEIAERGCIMMNTLRAGLELKVRISKRV